MRWTCHIVPMALASALALPGCFLFHEASREEPHCGPPAGQVCCTPSGRAVDIAPIGCPFECPTGSTLTPSASCEPPTPIDDGGTPPPPPIDAGRPPLECEPFRADTTCLSSWLVEPDVPFELPVSFDTCGCCAETECAVEVTTIDGAPTLRLTTTMCPDPCDCDSCVRPEGSCSVPPLEQGLWNVVVNGAPAFELPVFRDPGFAPPPPACVRYAEEDACRTSERMPDASGYRASEVCVTPTAGWPERATVTISHDCWGCDLQGPCLVRIDPRYTDDLPPGGEIQLGPTQFTSECDVDCPEVCNLAERHCDLPPLEPGDYYRVWLDGEAVLSFVAGGSAPICSGEPVPPG